MNIRTWLPQSLLGLGTGLLVWWGCPDVAIAHSLDASFSPEISPELSQRFLSGSLTPATVFTGLAIAFGMGSAHALSPGHGKTMVAAYLAGTQGTPLHAVLLGIITTIAHTFGAFALGVLTLIASQYMLTDQIDSALSLVSGLTICGVGLGLLDRRLRDWQPDHPHPADHVHPHAHFPESASLKSLIVLGIAGGIVPCPSALVLLLSAIALHQAAYGLLLVGGFSLGLATVLTFLGLAVVYARQWFTPWALGGRLTKQLPVFSAVAIVCVGMTLTIYAII